MSAMSPDDVCKFIDEVIVKLDAQSSHSPSKTRGIVTHERASNITTDALKLLKTLRNAYAPISKLPNETLIEIFTMVEHSDKIAQICQHWRHLAVGTPALWTHPPTHHHDHTLRFLKRSKKTLLDVYISKGTAFVTASTILKNMGRIRSLHVDQTCRYLLDLQKVNRSTPHLEELSIERWDDGSLEEFTFSPAAFGVSSILRKLELNNVCLDWCMLLQLPALTNLSLHDIMVTHDVTGTELTATLRGMPFLQELSMSFGDIELREYSSATLFEPIHLPHLSDLDIRSRSHRGHIDHFLTHAALPRLRQLHVDYGDDPVDHSPMVRTVASAIRNGDACPLKCLTIGSDVIRIRSLPFSRDGPYVEILLPVTREDFDTDDFVMATHILSCVTPINSEGFTPLVRLAIATLDLTSNELRQLFGGLPHLKHVEFSWKLAASFIEGLSIPLDHDNNCPIPFSRLNSVEWYGPSFHATPYPDPGLFDALIDCLMQRCEYGAPIDNLVLKCCNVAADSVECKLLKEIVVNFRVTSGFW